VTVDPVNFGNGLQGYSLVSATNAVVNISAFTPGTVGPVTATFTVPNTSQPVDFTLRATSRFSGVLIRAQCGGVTKPQSKFSMTDISFLHNNVAAGFESLLGYTKQEEQK
jgi:hypothetical protein